VSVAVIIEQTIVNDVQESIIQEPALVKSDKKKKRSKKKNKTFL
jgi:hypothetical protein